MIQRNESYPDTLTQARFDCKCECGNVATVRYRKLRYGRSSQCQLCVTVCMQMSQKRPVEKLKGTTIGKYIVLRRDGKSPNTFSKCRWWCRCECGVVKSVAHSALVNGRATMCIQCSGRVNSAIHDKGYEIDGKWYSSRDAIKKSGVSRQRLSQKRNREKGLCNCGNECIEGKSQCERCNESSRKTQKERQKRLKAEKKCRCGKRRVEGLARCEQCIATQKKNQKDRRSQLLNDGLCSCGNKLGSRFADCDECRQRRKDLYAAKKAAKQPRTGNS